MYCLIRIICKKLYLFLFLFPSIVFSQSGTEFWLTIPELTQTHGIEWGSGGLVKHVVVSTLSSPATVTASVPANPAFKPIVVTVPANSTERISFEAFDELLEMIEYDTITKQGILIESSDVITAYLESMEPWNPDIFSLKGRHSLGTDFYVPFQDKLANNNPMNVQPYSTIDIVATEDGTIVEITPADSVAKRDGTSYLPGQTFTIVLNKGEAYSARALHFTAEGHLGGTHITSSRPIAVILKDDSVYLGGGFDLNGDQLVPVNRTGSQYIVMKGGINPQSMGGGANEYAFVVPTEDNTTFTVNGAEFGTFDAGEQASIPIADQYTVIESGGESFYCYHFVSAKGETGGAILPPTDQCSGSTRTGFSYSYGEPDPNNPDGGQQLYIMIMVRTGAEDAFLVDGQVASWLDPTQFQQVSAYWSAAKFGPLFNTDLEEGPHLITNSKDLFHTGYINTTGSGVLYGYFSDFESQDVEALAAKTNESSATFCRGEVIQLRVDGGVNYSWRGFDPDNPSVDHSQYIDEPLKYNPIIDPNIPDGSYAFEVTVGNACGAAVILDTVLLDVMPSPEPKDITVEFCESELGSNCVTGKDLTAYVDELAGAGETMTAVKWEKDVYDEMYMYSDFDYAKSLSIKSVNVGAIEKSKTIPVKDGVNSSDNALYFTSKGDQGSVSIAPLVGPSFDLSEGSLFSMKVFVDVWQSQYRTGSRTVTLSLMNDTDSVAVSQTVSGFGFWKDVEFDFSSINTTDLFSKGQITFSDLPADNSDYFYIDDFQKFVNYQKEQILFPDSAQFCGNTDIYVTLENEAGCEIFSTIHATVVEGDFSVANSLVDAEFCESEVGSSCIESADLTSYIDEIIGGDASIEPIFIEKEVFDAMYSYEDFEGETSMSIATEQSVTLEFPVVNPAASDANPSERVLHYTVGGNSGDLKFVPLGNSFDFSTGDVVTLKIYNDRGTNTCYPRTFTLSFFNEGENDTITVSQVLDVCNTWTEVEFDFNSFNSDEIYSKAELKNQSDWTSYSYYIDDFMKFVDERVEEVDDASSVALCGTPNVSVILQNSEGCVTKATIETSIGEGDFSINSPLEAKICKTLGDGETSSELDLSEYSAEFIDGSTELDVIKWEGDIIDSIRVFDDFEGDRAITHSGWINEQNNPDLTAENQSARCWQAGEGTSSFTFNKMQDFSIGYIYAFDVYLLASEWGTDDFSINLQLQTEDGTVLNNSNGPYIYLHDDDSVWLHLEFDFSAHASVTNVTQADIILVGANSYYIDNISMIYAPIRSEFEEGVVETYDGAVYYATVQNSEGCVVMGKLNVDMSVCGPPVSDTTLVVCENLKGSASASGIDISVYEADMKLNIDEHSVEWFTDADLSVSLVDPENVTVKREDIIYAKVSNPEGLFDTAKLFVDVHSLPEITFPEIPDVCVADTSIEINGAQPIGGIYKSESAYFHDDSLFNIVNSGISTIRYVYTDTIGCVDSLDQILTVNGLPDIKLTTTDFSYCETSDVDLAVAPETDAEYAWYFNGVLQSAETNNSLEDASAGLYRVEKTLNGCTSAIDSIEVKGFDKPEYAYIGGGTICYGGTAPEVGVDIAGIIPYELTYDDHTGTSQTVAITDQTYMFPFTETDPGEYSFTITSLSDSAGCMADISGDAVELSILPAATSPWIADPITAFCVNSSSVDLTAYVTIADGEFSGDGVTADNFDPAVAGDGTFTIQYEYEFEGKCTATDDIEFTVYSIPVPVFDFPLSVCISEDAYGLAIETNTDIAAGTFSGTGVISNQFDPEIAGVGTHEITYEFELVNACQSTATVEITVHTLPEPMIGTGDDLTFCISDDSFTVPVSPAGGTLSGTGISTDEFIPVDAGQGDHEITYYIKDAEGCENQTSVQFSVLFTEPVQEQAFTFVETDIKPTISVESISSAEVYWYETETSASSIASGAEFTHGETAVIETSYWVSQSVDGCESVRTEIKLNIIDCYTPAPVIANPDRTICLYADDETFTAETINDNAEVRWYDADDKLLHTGKTYSPSIDDDLTFYAVQDTGCQSLPVDLSITFIKPETPTLEQSGDICEGTGNITVSETSGLSTIYWFDAEPAYPAETANRVSSDSDYETAVTAASDYTFWAVSELDGCVSESASVGFTIKAIPDAPEVTSNWSCYGDDINDLSAIGTDIQWYENETTDNILGAGSSLIISETDTYIYTFYATQTVDGCESNRIPVEYEIKVLPDAPLVENETICSNFDLPEITATVDYDEVNWYKSEIETVAYKSGKTIQLEEGDLQLYVSQFGNECESERSEFILTVVPQPAKPIIDNKTVCEGISDVRLTANVTADWFADTNAVVLATADYLEIASPLAGEATYYACQVVDGCYSYFGEATLTIIEQPSQPVVDEIALESCEGDILTFTATPNAGNEIVWYRNDGSEIIRGNEFMPELEIIAGETTLFEVKQTLGECFSSAVQLGCHVYEIPEAPIIFASSFCLDDTQMQISAMSSANVEWLDELGQVIHKDESFNIISQVQNAGAVSVFARSLSDFGCISETVKKDISIGEIPEPIILGDDTFCAFSNVTYTVMGQLDNSTLEWSSGNVGDLSIASNDDGTELNLMYESAGVDMLTITETSPLGCVGKDSKEIQIAPKPVADFEYTINNDEVEFVNISEYSAEGIASGELGSSLSSVWNYGRPFDEDTIVESSDFFEKVKRTYKYGDYNINLKVENGYGCVDETDKNIFVELIGTLFIPNAVAPKSLAKGPREFKPIGMNITEYNITIYDNWGNIVWYSDKLENGMPAEGWNGSYEEGEFRSDVFKWKIEATFEGDIEWKGILDSNGNYTKMGNIIVLR